MGLTFSYLVVFWRDNNLNRTNSNPELLTPLFNIRDTDETNSPTSLEEIEIT